MCPEGAGGTEPRTWTIYVCPECGGIGGDEACLDHEPGLDGRPFREPIEVEEKAAAEARDDPREAAARRAHPDMEAPEFRPDCVGCMCELRKGAGRDA